MYIYTSIIRQRRRAGSVSANVANANADTGGGAVLLRPVMPLFGSHGLGLAAVAAAAAVAVVVLACLARLLEPRPDHTARITMRWGGRLQGDDLQLRCLAQKVETAAAPTQAQCPSHRLQRSLHEVPKRRRLFCD